MPLQTSWQEGLTPEFALANVYNRTWSQYV